MLSLTRRMIVSLAVCALLSLTFTTAAALACPGGGGESGGERVTLIPTSATFERVGARRTFTFTYWEGRELNDEVLRHITPGGGFEIVEAGAATECVTRKRRLSPGESCTVVVEAKRTGERARLFVELFHSGLTGTSELSS